MRFSNPEEVLGALVEAYYEKRNIETVLSCVTDDIEWVGTENNDSAKGKEALKELLENDIAAFPDSFHVALEEPDIQKFGEDVVVLTITGRQVATPGLVGGFAIRGTVCCVKTEGGWLVANIHASVPNSEMEKYSFKKELDAKRIQEKTLMAGIPGGVAIYRIKKDKSIKTDYVSDGLAKMCGYDSGVEFQSVLAEQSMIGTVKEDIPLVVEAVKKSLATGESISVRYRIFTKNGEEILNRMDANIINDNLAEDDRAVLYAVHTIVSDESKRIIESEKISNELLNVAPAGLGVYEFEDGKMTRAFLNNAFYDMLGSASEYKKKYSGKNMLNLAHPEDVQNIRDFFHILMDSKDKMQLDFRLKKNDNTWIWVHAMGTSTERINNHVKIYIAYYECTEAKARELQLLQNQHAVELAQSQGGLAIWTYNIDKGCLIQQAPKDSYGHMGYPICIKNVPKCFTESGSVHPDDIEKYLAAYQKIADGAETADEIYRMINQETGQYGWVHMFYRRMENNLDGDRMAVGFSLDADKQQEAIERYHMEEKLRSQMYKDAVMYMEYNLMSNKYDGENNLTETYRSQDWECTTAECYRNNMSSIVDEQYLDEFVAKMYAKNLLKAFKNGETNVSCEYRSKPRHGMPSLWYTVTAIMAQHPDTGDVMAFVYIVNTEDKKERQLALSNSLTDGIESIATIRILDGKSRLIRSNYTCTPGNVGEYFTYDENFVQRSHSSVMPEDSEFSYRAALLPTIIEELKTKEVYQYSVSTQRYDEPPKRQLFRFRYLDDRKTVILLSISDITDIYNEEQTQKKRLEEALANVQKASGAKSDFYSRMSHDMRTPMNGILGIAELAKQENDPELLHADIEKIRQSGLYMLSLINDTLDLQRIESGRMTIEPVACNTKDLIFGAVSMMQMSAKEKDITLEIKNVNADMTTFVRVDPIRVRQIVVNLISNSIKFTPRGGKVTFSVEVLSRDEKYVHDRIVVSDTGVGMSQEFIDNKLFQPFMQERNDMTMQYAGSGLGLSIVKKLLDMMNAKIEVKSEIGKGTEFTIYIDFELVQNADTTEMVGKKAIHDQSSISKIKGKHILLCEDHPLNAEITMRLIKRAGGMIDWVKDGAEGVKKFSESPTDYYDAILMDIRMPNMDGIEATKKIRATNRQDAKTVPIIAMSANAYKEDVEKSLQAGMNEHLAKPVDPKKLYAALGSMEKI